MRDLIQKAPTSATLALMLSFMVLSAQPSVSAPDSVERGTPAAADGELFDLMLDIKSSIRDLYRAAQDPGKRSEALEALHALQKHVVAAKQMPPPKIEEMEESKREAYRLGFRRELAELLQETTRIELAIIDGKTDEAVKRIREDLIELRDRAHDTYQVDDK